jgi:predicted Ser/Thr protein kinase|tara:strand:+ start:78 stop:719 length:642 start_codon:yes stop_codon:yes gene_type:complete
MKSMATILLRKVGIDGPFGLEMLAGGRNNRVARIDVGDRKLILKAYFSDPDDPRDRFTAETRFAEFAWSNGVTCINQLLASDAESRAALYSYAEGTRIGPGEVTREAVDQAMDFVVALNARRDAGRTLAPASEACFSLTDHLAMAAERISRLESNVIERMAKDFVHDALIPAWSKIAAKIRANPNIELNQVLGDRERCISPSDFGFHNAVKGV